MFQSLTRILNAKIYLFACHKACNYHSKTINECQDEDKLILQCLSCKIYLAWPRGLFICIIVIYLLSLFNLLLLI